MKILFAVAVVALLTLGATPLCAQAPELEKGVYVYDGNLPLEVDRHSSPCVIDWNNDNKKDLVIGQFGYGYIWLFLNQGTDLNPVFNGGSYIYSGSVPISANSG